jgi:hypothetical protein
MRGDVQAIFKLTPHEKQVMMFSATLSQDVRPVCKKFMSNVRGPLWARGRGWPAGGGSAPCQRRRALGAGRQRSRLAASPRETRLARRAPAAAIAGFA